MRWRVLGAVVVLAVVGAGAGFGLAELTRAQPRRFDTPAPVPAVSPAMPTVAPPVVEPDPTDAPLAVGLPDHRTKLPTGRSYPLTLRVPDGWVRYRPDVRLQKWTWLGPQETEYTYIMRVEVLAGRTQSPGSQLGGRLRALEEAETNQDIADLDVEERSSDAATATLAATFIDQGDHRRYTRERWVALTDSFAYATVAVTGREVDRAGIDSLLDRVTDSLVAR